MMTIGENIACVLPTLRSGAEAYRDAPACTVAGNCITHGEMWRLADTVAERLNALGISENEIVAVVLDRDVRWSAAILGVMASGAAFLPIDAALPVERIRYMLHDSGVRHVVTTAAVNTRLAMVLGSSVTTLESLVTTNSGTRSWRTHIAHGDAAAYVIYTSGSTGAPKGVLVAHRSLAFSLDARLAFYADTIQEGPPCVVSAYGFGVDSILAGFFWAVATGGHLILPAAGEERDAVALSRLLMNARPTHLDFVPGLYSLLLDISPPEAFRSVRCTVVGGEALPRGVLHQHARILPAVPLVNEYGPTECTIWSSAKRFAGAREDGDVTIGVPLPGTSFLLTDAHGEAVPDGEVGDLTISGPHVAQGYVGDAMRTVHSFRDVPDSNGRITRSYLTGDRARRLSTGEYVYLGRADDQVQVNGFRVELGEVEFALSGLAAVQQAAVTLHGSQAVSRLVAYVVLHPGMLLTSSEMRRALGRTLPPHMIPAILILVDTLPRTPSGKVDRSALPSPFQTNVNPDDSAVTYDGVERAMADAWCEALGGGATIRRADNFFELGGTSLMAVRLVAELKRKHAVTIDVSDLFHRSLREIAADVRARNTDS